MYLNCHSYYSLKYGTLSVEDLVRLGKENGAKSLVLTDINTTMGVMDFIKECRNSNIHPIAGIEFRNGNDLLYIGIAKNNIGFKELNTFVSEYNLAKAPLPVLAPDFENVFVIYPYEIYQGQALKDYEYIGIRPGQLNQLITKKHLLPKCVILAPVTFERKEHFYVHCVLRAIDNNCLLSMIKKEYCAHQDEIFKSENELFQCFKDFPILIKNTENILANASIDIDFTTIKNKQIYSASRYDDKLLLEKLAYDGMKRRYGCQNKEAIRRIENELAIIDKLGFSAYFLITWDIIRYSQSRGFYHVGRGSGANSTVAYCLGITDVDPIELNLYFERFLNPKRTSPPDFDVDFAWNNRDDIQDYIFKRHGYKHTALLGATTTFQDRAILRELGKVYGLPKEEIDRLVSNPSANLNIDAQTKRIAAIGSFIMDFPNNRSIHAGGVLISEEPITQYTALDMPPKGFQTTHFDMYVAEMIRLEKLDILSQRGIGHINEAAEIIKENKGKVVNVHDIQAFKQDKKINEHLSKGQAIGCFYVESPAMRGLLQKLKCDGYIKLVAASSVIRPGVAQSGMMGEYIKRSANQNSFEYLHPIFKEHLAETYGVMVYQEDVIKICHYFAGLDLADADILRRAMSGKYRGKKEFERIKNTFFANCRDKGYSDELAQEVWRQISSFAGYAFSKAHSASYAVESYQSLFLKTYYPLEFYTAVVNNFGGFYGSWVYLTEFKKHGGTVELPCVNKSENLAKLYDTTLYIGFIHVKGLERKTIKAIINERIANGTYSSLDDLLNRVPMSKEQAILLVKIGALRFTGQTKQSLYWRVHFLLDKSDKEEIVHQKLFGIPRIKDFKLPDFHHDILMDAYDEIELIGFSVTLSLFDFLVTGYQGNVTAKDLHKNIGKTVRILGNLVTRKYARTKKGTMMQFGCFYDIENNFFDTVNWPDNLKRWPFTGMGVYLIEGKVVSDFGFASVEVNKMSRLKIKPDPRYNESRAADKPKNPLKNIEENHYNRQTNVA